MKNAKPPARQGTTMRKIFDFVDRQSGRVLEGRITLMARGEGIKDKQIAYALNNLCYRGHLVKDRASGMVYYRVAPYDHYIARYRKAQATDAKSRRRTNKNEPPKEMPTRPLSGLVQHGVTQWSSPSMKGWAS